MRRIPDHWLIFACLLIYVVILALLTGDTGFQADDWWILSVPYWESFPRSIWTYALEFCRPLEGLPWLTLFPVFGFSRTLYNLLALALYAGTNLFFGLCLNRMFPDRKRFVTVTMLFSFFLPTVCPLTYVFHMDNIWTCTLFFWASAYAFQRWAEGNAAPSGLVLPVSLYYLGTLAYDAANLLIFLVPVFVYPCRQRSIKVVPERVFWFRLGLAIALGFTALLCTRFVLFHGGAIGIRSVFPAFSLVCSYVTTLVPYFTAAFTSLSADPWAIAAGCAVSLCAGILLFFRDVPTGDNEGHGRVAAVNRKSSTYIFVCAFGLMVLGTFQYLVAGYGAALGFHGESRIYSVSSFGLAMLLGHATTCWTRKHVLYVTQAIAVLIIGFMATFHVDLRRSWQEAQRINCNLWKSLTPQVPDVAPGTTLLFLDLQSYVSNRAIIFGGVNGLREFIRIFYHRRDIDAHFLYPAGHTRREKKSKFATVSHAGVVARGSLPSEPAPLDTLVIVRRVGERLVLLDGISAKEDLAAIHWQGISAIRTNRARILRASGPRKARAGVCCRWCGR